MGRIVGNYGKFLGQADMVMTAEKNDFLEICGNKFRVLKASFKDCPIEDRKTFRQAKCIMPISVGQPAHEGFKFKATIELVNRSFESCVILIDDTLQRHTMQIGMSGEKERFYSLSKTEGELWLERSIDTIKTLQIPHQVIHWDKWLSHEKYDKQYKLIEKTYEENSEFKRAVDENIDEFLCRFKKNNPNLPFNQKRAFNLCLDYLKEECAGMCLWTEEKCDFELYPTGRNKAMAATYKLFIHDQHPTLLKPVSLRFKKHWKSLNNINQSSQPASTPETSS